MYYNVVLYYFFKKIEFDFDDFVSILVIEMQFYRKIWMDIFQSYSFLNEKKID